MLSSLLSLGLHASSPLGSRLHTRRLPCPRAALDDAGFSSGPSKADLYDDEALQAIWNIHTEYFGDTSVGDAAGDAADDAADDAGYDAADDASPANIMGGLHEAVLLALATEPDTRGEAEGESADDTPVGLASLQQLLGLSDKSWATMKRNVPEVEALVRSGPGATSGWASLLALQERVGLSDAELRAAVQRLPQLLGYDYDTEVGPPLESLTVELGLETDELKKLVTKVPQLLGLDFAEAIEPRLETLRAEGDGRLSGAELKEKLLAKPSALGVEVRGGFKPFPTPGNGV